MIYERHVPIAGSRTRYLESGEGRPLVFLHAFPLNADMWRRQLSDAPSEWRCIAPDMRGFGPGTIAPGTTPTIDEYASDVLALLDAIGIARAVFVGLSMGGYVSFAIARKALDRIDGLVLADTKAAGDTAEGKAGRLAMIETLRTKGLEAVIDGLLAKLPGETTRSQRKDTVAEIRQLMAANRLEAVEAALYVLMTRPDSTPDLRSISCPTLVIVGDEDTVTPRADADVLASTISSAELVVLRRSGHLSNLETPAEFTSALAAFLSRAF
jgi:pimeloyl-ACP methyl ester carboxylesterase